MKHFVMPEEKWRKLCAKQCRARRKQYGDDKDYCREHDGVCPECVDDAIREVPEKYKVSPKEVGLYEPLPGFSQRDIR